MVRMANWSAEAIQRLGEAVKARRNELGVSQLEVSHSGGPANSTLTSIENGNQTALNYKTLRKLDVGLRWPREHALSILTGKRLDHLVTGSDGLENIPTDALVSVVSAFIAELRKRASGSELWPAEFVDGDDAP